MHRLVSEAGSEVVGSENILGASDLRRCTSMGQCFCIHLHLLLCHAKAEGRERRKEEICCQGVASTLPCSGAACKAAVGLRRAGRSRQVERLEHSCLKERMLWCVGGNAESLRWSFQSCSPGSLQRKLQNVEKAPNPEVLKCCHGALCTTLLAPMGSYWHMFPGCTGVVLLAAEKQ